MTTYEDLSPYVYEPTDPSVTTLNVGWLGRASSFDTGSVDEQVRAALVLLAADHDVNLMRGMHDCELCDRESPIREPLNDRVVALGCSEIHVTADDGVVYAAPTLVIHYIDEHGYLPPQAFTDAVVATMRRLEADRGWQAAKERLPLGLEVWGTVTAKMTFGIVLRLDDVPDVASVVDAISYRPRGDQAELPDPGARVHGVVVDHAEHNWQIKVRVGPAAR